MEGMGSAVNENDGKSTTPGSRNTTSGDTIPRTDGTYGSGNVNGSGNEEGDNSTLGEQRNGSMACSSGGGGKEPPRSIKRPDVSTPTNEPGRGATATDVQSVSRRPRECRLLHLVLANYGVHAYQERVPLQLMDFAYRYTSGIINDAVQLVSNGYGVPSQASTGSFHRTGSTSAYGGSAGSAGGCSSGGSNYSSQDLSSGISLTSLRLAIASRLNYQFQTSLPKEWWLELAAEKNRISLPRIPSDYGVRLMHEKYCLTGVNWGLDDMQSTTCEDGDNDGDNDTSTTLDEEDDVVMRC